MLNGGPRSWIRLRVSTPCPRAANYKCKEPGRRHSAQCVPGMCAQGSKGAESHTRDMHTPRWFASHARDGQPAMAPHRRDDSEGVGSQCERNVYVHHLGSRTLLRVKGSHHVHFHDVVVRGRQHTPVYKHVKKVGGKMLPQGRVADGSEMSAGAFWLERRVVPKFLPHKIHSRTQVLLGVARYPSGQRGREWNHGITQRVE